jgi:endonuclease/exonuclease/phosphatase (EEP) superfamily protein YafD
VIAAWAMIRGVGEDWWLATILLFMPRWFLLAPLPFLVGASAWVRRPAHWLLHSATALVILGPLMGFVIPASLFASTPSQTGSKLRIMTFNGGRGTLRSDELIKLVEQERVDLICFQENHSDARLEKFFSKGWYRDRAGYVASRYPIVAELEPLIDDSTTEVRYTARLIRVRVRIPSGQEILVASLHMPTLRQGLERFVTKHPDRLKSQDARRLELHAAWWAHQMDRVVGKLAEAQETPFLVGGDFNMPSDSTTMATLRGVFHFAFDETGWGYGYTKPSWLPWIRIDHIVSSPGWTFGHCWVGPDLGSDHLPLLAEVTLHEPERTDREKTR